ncbi:MAG: DNA primase [Candidatus Saccharibacteria bacterium]|nr:DNA primase [Candidatus Saccharibacteria bacterium]
MYSDAKEEIRSKLAIEDVIGEYVHLRRSGRYWKGLSPFTNERTPSFFVTPDRDIWHDFSSNRGGDIFSFIMEMEGLDFKGAMELLARKAGVDLSQYQSPSARGLAARKERCYQMNNLAVNYYQRELIKSSAAMEYAAGKRRLAKETVLEWGIGYAPSRPSLEKLLADKGYDKKEMREAGLLGYSGRELFFNRLIIPLRDRKGQVVGFTGRIIGSGEPKYLNTPDTMLYHKGSQLFGLSFAAQAIRRAGFSVIVEGNLDVISSHQAGVKNVVGVAGTALTVEHLKSLSRLSNDIRFCFDSDKAGVAATEKAIKLAGPLELKLSVIDYSGQGAKDPDELINIDPQLWQQALDNYQPAVNWVRDYYVRTVGVDTVEGKKLVSDKTLDVIQALSDPVEREGYIRELAEVTGISVESLMSRINMIATEKEQERQPRVSKQSKVAKIDVKAVPREQRFRYLDNILAYLGSQPKIRSRYLIKLNDKRLSPVDVEIKKWLIETNLWGDTLVDQISSQIESDQTDADLLDQVRNKLVQLQMLNDRAQAGIEGIKSEADLLDYFCHYEHNYYMNKAKELTTKALQTDAASSESVRLADQAREVRKTAESLDPGWNRRNNYQGLKKLWSLSGLQQ